MKVIDVKEAKENLEKILEEVEKGEKVILKSKNKEFVIYPKSKRKLGIFKNKVQIEPDIDKPLPKEIIEDFYN
ncbi:MULTISPECIES: type II toxin-antitoxin system prevent-host-death family antitoxin [unclassified Persephonella]|uniref:type II toxin-antitoxin system Phd/YefM family antitoxin n=1 Tax=unclassified Persephonella TaxID=2641955 RepID=UPI00049779EA|nr:type II toxin-antitoxin system prevent-host-death family antitoxin [Persephonella sp. KM09-Lau-8]